MTRPEPVTSEAITKAAEECRAAWAAVPGATHGWHIHHEVLLESLTQPIEERIRFILDEKARYETEEQIVLRLQLMRPATLNEAIASAYEAWRAIRATWIADPKNEDASTADSVAADAYYTIVIAEQDALHAEQCKDCPWNADQRTIFPSSTA